MLWGAKWSSSEPLIRLRRGHNLGPRHVVSTEPRYKHGRWRVPEGGLSEVAIKNEIGVLYDAEKKKAFDARGAASGSTSGGAGLPSRPAPGADRDRPAGMFLQPEGLRGQLRGSTRRREHIKGDVEDRTTT